MSSQSKNNPYEKPAGGWGAVKATNRFIGSSKAPLKSIKSLLQVNQPDGFDCPGCAWPEPAEGAGRFEFCENGAKAVTWETTAKRVDPAFFAAHPVELLREQTDHWLESQGRLTHPMKYNVASDRYEAVTWDTAFAEIGGALKSLADPDKAEFYTSGRTSNEAAFMYQLLARLLGTNNMPDCSNMCHESSGVALNEVIGVGKGTVTLEDFEYADAIFVIGQNPGTNHPRMLSELQKASARGARIVSINPLRERGLEEFLHPQHFGAMLRRKATPISSLYLQPLVSGDMAVLKGMIKFVLDEPGRIDKTFIEDFTDGFEEFRSEVKRATWEEIEKQSGLSRDQIKQAADAYMQSERVIVCWAMGLTQQKHAVAVIQEIVNLLLLRANIGKVGAGACPVRGHSNVQGDRTMGINHTPPAEFLERLGKQFGFDPPHKHGHDVVAAIEAMHAGKSKVFIGLGGNLVAAAPDTDFTDEALRRCELTVSIATKLNRTHLACGKASFVLPCLGRTEIDVQGGVAQKVTVEDSMSQVHASQGRNAPASNELLSEPAIVAGIARQAVGDRSSIDWEAWVGNYGKIRSEIAKVLPAFKDFNDRIKTPGGFYLGNTAREKAFNTASNRARFTVHSLPDLSLPADQLRLMTLRSHDQYNTTVYDNNDRYRGVQGTRKVIFLSERDLEARGLKDGELVNITSHFEDRTRSIEGYTIVAYDIPVGCAAGYFPEMNPLVSVKSFADRSFTPTSKFIPITIAKH